ncbi:hypothetical protein C1646_776572, partial [Rhizophagus diaphanus]
IVQLIAWEFAQNLHPFTAGLIGQHLAEKEGWIPTPLFPPDRDLAVRFVGSCACNAQVTSILVWDINEADMLVNWLAKNKRRPNWTRTEQGTLIKYEDETVVETGQELLPDFDNSLFTKAKNSAELEEVRAKYEAELDKKRKQYESAIVLEIPEIKYGQWRKKKDGYTYRKEASSWAINHKYSCFRNSIGKSEIRNSEIRRIQ